METSQKHQHIFDVEIALTEKALEVVMACAGDTNEHRKYYMKMRSSEYQVITKNPSFDLSLGAEINDILSLGIMVMAQQLGITFDYGDLSLHPFRNKLPVIDAKLSNIDGTVKTRYKPITTALDENGKTINIQDLKKYHPMKEIKQLSDIDTSTEVGKLLMTAIIELANAKEFSTEESFNHIVIWKEGYKEFNTFR